jgi:molybdopterin-guanine dinucleotide biosynthesis protein A
VTPSVIAIVLAGGRSSRFGSDKLAARLEDRTLLDRAIEAVDGLASDIVVVAAPGAFPSLAATRARIHLAHDPEAFGGPLVGLATGLDTAARLEGAGAPDIAVLVVGGDMPSLRPTVLRLLLDALVAGGRDATERVDAAILAGPDALVRPLPAALRLGPARSACGKALAAGDRSLRSALARLAPSVVPEARWRPLDPDGESLRDVDRPEDLGSEYPPRR